MSDTHKARTQSVIQAGIIWFRLHAYVWMCHVGAVGLPVSVERSDAAAVSDKPTARPPDRSTDRLKETSEISSSNSRSMNSLVCVGGSRFPTVGRRKWPQSLPPTHRGKRTGSEKEEKKTATATKLGAGIPTRALPACIRATAANTTTSTSTTATEAAASRMSRAVIHTLLLRQRVQQATGNATREQQQWRQPVNCVRVCVCASTAAVVGSSHEAGKRWAHFSSAPRPSNPTVGGGCCSGTRFVNLEAGESDQSGARSSSSRVGLRTVVSDQRN